MTFFKTPAYPLILLTFLFFSCASGQTRYSDPAEVEGSMAWGPKEINETVKKMTDSMYSFLKKSGSPAYLEFVKIQNNSSEHIDTKSLAQDISSELLKKNIRFVDRSERTDQVKEMQFGKSGLVDQESAIPLGELKSPNYKLRGFISDNVRYNNGEKIQYLVITLELLQMSSGVIQWKEQQKFLKITKIERYGL